uniref:Uncharacterized protein n=2 Tax=Phlebotomus papatasi TaxID=29031 RepID=A0A1B0GPV3_PHLPP
MRIRRPRGIPNWQLMLTVAVGIFGGIYIYKPLFLKYRQERSPPSITSGTPAIAASTVTDTTGNP